MRNVGPRLRSAYRSSVDRAPVDEEKVWRGMTFHHFGLILSALFGLIAVLVSCYLIWRHATHYLKPWEQRQLSLISLPTSNPSDFDLASSVFSSWFPFTPPFRSCLTSSTTMLYISRSSETATKRSPSRVSLPCYAIISPLISTTRRISFGASSQGPGYGRFRGQSNVAPICGGHLEAD